LHACGKIFEQKEMLDALVVFDQRGFGIARLVIACKLDGRPEARLG
jgi:hypothetical protein